MVIPTIKVGVNGEKAAAGYRYLWLKFVSGFAPNRHCARCLSGGYSKRVRNNLPEGPQVLVMDEKPEAACLYLCGVTPGALWQAWGNNLHIPFVPEAGSVIEKVDYRGQLFVIENARELTFPPLPDGWGGYNRSYTTCRNFQFAVDYFGARNEKLPDLPIFKLANPPPAVID
jgi:hypothetical protein